MRTLRNDQTAAAGAAVLMIAIALTAPLNYGFGLALAWLLPTSEFGVVSVLLTVLLLATSVLAAGFPWALARSVARAESGADRDHGNAGIAPAFRAALVGNVGFGVALAAGFAGVQLTTGAILPGVGADITLLIAATIVLLALGQVLIGALQGARRFTAVSLARVLEVVAKVGLGVGAVALLALGAVGIAWAVLIAAGVAAGCAWWTLRDRLPRLRGAMAGWRSFAAAAPMALGTAGFGLIGTLDILLLPALGHGHGVTFAAAGLYQAGALVAKAPFLVGSALSDVMFPFLAGARDSREAHSRFVSTLRWLPLVLVPTLLVLIISPASVVGRLFPADFAGAVELTRLIALGTVGLIAGDMLLKGLFARGLASAAATRVLAAPAVEVVVMAVLVPHLGAIGAAAGFAAGAWTAVGVLGAVYLRHHRVGALPVRRTAGWLAATGALAGLLVGATAVPGALDLALVVLGLVAYVVIVVRLDVLPEADVATARRMLSRVTGPRPSPAVEEGTLV